MNKPELFDDNYQATYCPEDDKLRLYVGRVPKDEYLALRAEGWTSTPKQSEAGGGEFSAVWTPEREQTAISYADLIGDEDMSPADRAADRAERFAGYRDKREGESLQLADSYDSGPAVHGYQSQALAERKAAQHDRIAGRAVSQWEKANYWQHRTAGVIANALHKQSPGVRMGRIKILESDIRKAEKAHEEYHTFRLFSWQIMDSILKDPENLIWTRGGAEVLLYADIMPEEPGNEEGKKRFSYSQKCLGMALCALQHCKNGFDDDKLRKDLRSGTITPKEVAKIYLENHEQPAAEAGKPFGPWYTHNLLRLAYENQMLEAQGGRLAHVEIEPGGFIGNSQIITVSKSPATGRVTSVKVKVPKKEGWDYRRRGVAGADYDLMVVETERLQPGLYRPPTDEEREAFLQWQKDDRKARAKVAPKQPPLINLTRAEAEKLQAVWNAERAGSSYDKEPREVIEAEQARYSELSKGTYSNAEAVFIIGGGKQKGRSGFTAVAKIRSYRGSVIILADKPQKALTPDMWIDPKPAAYKEAVENINAVMDYVTIKSNWRNDEKPTPEQEQAFKQAVLCGLAYKNSETQCNITDAGYVIWKAAQQKEVAK